MADGSFFEGLVSMQFDDGGVVGKARSVVEALDQELKKAGVSGSATSQLGNLGGATAEINQVIGKFSELRNYIEQVTSAGAGMGAGMAQGFAAPLAELDKLQVRLRQIQVNQAQADPLGSLVRGAEAAVAAEKIKAQQAAAAGAPVPVVGANWRGNALGADFERQNAQMRERARAAKEIEETEARIVAKAPSVVEGEGSERRAFKPNTSAVEAGIKETQLAVPDPVGAANAGLLIAQNNVQKALAGAASQEQADERYLQARKSEIQAETTLYNAKVRLAGQVEKEAVERSAKANAAEERAAVQADPRYAALSGTNTRASLDTVGGVNSEASIKAQILQVEASRLRTEQEALAASAAGAKTTQELNEIALRRAQVDRRILANAQGQISQAGRDEFGGGAGRTGFFNGLSGGFGGAGGDGSNGIGGLLFQAGQAAKFYALYTVLSSITQVFGSLRTEAEKYTIAVNDLSIAMDVGKADAIDYAVEYAKVGATYAASPIESIQGATKFVRSFRVDDPSGVNAGYTKEQIGSFGASTTSVVQQLEGKDQVTKVTQDLVAITRAYGIGAAGVASVYDQMTQIAQHYGFSTGGQIISGVAQIGDLARSSGYDAPGAAALIASVQQATGVGSDQAAGDVKRFLGSQSTLDKVFETNKIGGDKPFNERLDALIVKMSTMTEVDRGNTLNSLGNPRIQAVVGALVSGKVDQDAATKAAADPNQTAGLAAAQATKRITESFGGAMDKLNTDLDQLKIAVINSGLVEFAGLLVQAFGGVLQALTGLVNLAQLLPAPLREAGAALGLMFAASRAIAGLQTALAGSSAANALRGAFQGSLGIGAGTNVAANAALTARGVEATAAQATAAQAATTQTALLTAANTAQAESAAAATGLTAAEAEATTTLATSNAAAATATTTQAAANEAQALLATVAAEDTVLLAEAQAEVVATTAAHTTALAAQTLAETEATTAAANLVLAQALQAETAATAATAEEVLAVAETEVTVTAAAVTAALEAQTAAALVAAEATGGFGVAMKGLAVSFASALVPMLGIAEAMIIIGTAAAVWQSHQKDTEINAAIGTILPPLHEAERLGNAKALTTNIAALDEQRKQLEDEQNSFGHSFGNFLSDTFTNGDNAAADYEKWLNLTKESEAGKKKLAALLKSGSNLTADSDLKDYFGSGLTIPSQGIDQLVGNRAGVGTTTSVVSRFIAQAPADSVGKLLNSGDTSVSDSAALFNYLNQAAGKSTNPGTRQVDTEKIRQLAIQMRDRLAARGASLAQLAQANEIVDAETKAAFDILLKNTAAQVDKIKNAKGPTGVSDPASLAQIKAIVTEALTKTTLAGDVDSTVALLAGVDQAFLVSYKEGLKAKIAILASEAASLQAALTAAKAAQALVSGYGDSMRHFGDEVVGHGNNLSGAGAAASNAQGVNTSAQSKLAQQLKTLDESLKYASPSGSDFKFPGDKSATAGPTAAQIEEARIASTEIPGDPLSAAATNLAVARYKMAQPKNQVEYYQALKALHDAQYAYGKAALDQANNLDISHIDITDPLAQARQKVRQAQAQLSFDSNRGAGSDVIQTDKNAVRQAQSDASKAAFDQQFSDQQTNYDLNRISLSSYLSYLNSQHDYLTAVRVKTRAQVDELNQVDRALKGLTEGLQGQFNLGDIKVPTPYEVRRALVAGASSSSTVQNITIAVNGGDLTAVRGVLAEYVGQAAMQTTGAGVRKIA